MGKTRTMYRLLQMTIMTIGVLMALSACTFSKNRIAMTPAEMSAPPSVGPIEYRLGWEHGCKSGLGAFGSDIQRVVYKFTMDLDFAQNKTYMRAWRDAFRYCRSFMNREMRDGYFYGEGGPKSDARNKAAVTRGEAPALWRGLDIPGWGESAWGAQVDDKFGYMGYEKTDWLGRTEEYQ